jgi:hypothetical protein
MKRTATAVFFSAVLGLVLGAQAHADSGPNPQPSKPRPKISVTFYSQGTLMSNFQASYGQTLNLCMKITPTASANFNAQPQLTFGSNPPGAVQGSFGGSALCGGSFIPVQIAVNTSTCTASATLTVLASSKTVTNFSGTILLPTADVASNPVNHTCAQGGATPPGGFTEWTITFSGKGSPNFDGLIVSESFETTSSDGGLDCGIPTPKIEPGPIGQNGHNQATDTLGSCDQTHLTSCETAFLQTVTIGACPVQTNKIVYSFSGGNFYTERADPSTAALQSSPPISQ